MVPGVPHGIATKAGARESLPQPNYTPRRQAPDARRGRDSTCTQATSTACHSRRNLLLATPSVMAGFGLLAGPGTLPAEASLVRFPATELNNRYYLVRAGESKAEAAGYVLTNPVYKQGGGADLSDLGRLQVESDTVERLGELQACEGACWIYPSITSCSYQTAELIAQTFGIGRNRIVPEYSFLDARGVGLLDNRPIEEVREQLRAGDSSSFVWRPPRGYDGTPNESVADVLTRVRQVLSITETQYSGQDVLFIAPDSDTLSTLQAAITGRDLRQHVGLAFRPGEVRAVQLDSSVVRDDTPVQFACPKPPNCW